MGLSRGVKECIGKYLAVELLMKCYGYRLFGVAVWWRCLLHSSYTHHQIVFRRSARILRSPSHCLFTAYSFRLRN